MTPRNKQTLPNIFILWDNWSTRQNRPGATLTGYNILRDPNQDESKLSALKLFWLRYRWIALRNRANYFKYRIIGHKVVNPQTSITGDDPTDHPNGKSGLRITKIDDVYDYYFIKQWSKNYCIRLRFGYKTDTSITVGTYLQFEFSFNPFNPFF